MALSCESWLEKIFLQRVLTKGRFGCILSKLDSRGSLKTEQ